MTTLAERDQIIDRLGGADPGWVTAAYTAVEQVARQRPMVTTDDLWPLLTFPAGLAGGRAMGKIVRHALASGLLEKATSGGFLLCLDHANLDSVRTQDGTIIRHQGPLVVYRSLVFDTSGLLEPQERDGSGLVQESHRLYENGLATL